MKPGLLQTLLLKTLGFFLIWLLLSESFEVFHVGLGLLAAFAVAWFNTDRSAPRFVMLRWRVLWYFPWLVGRIFQSGFHLSVLILHPALPIDPKFIPYRTKLKAQGAIVLLGNSITLTPGTLTAEVDGQELVVHAMDDQAAADAMSGRLERQVAGLFHDRGNFVEAG